ncbi:ParB family protein [Providencia stuartii]|uniref:ParB family protein n=1 Tax=Providencia TaxID=586 RepID=UPI00201E4745|nr:MULTISPECIES: ParB family protein [Providencia]EMA4784609.1 ParB/RepB/Spo0J family partition protein [Providencia rettgeri]EMB3084622.1 ParB/RepB/Spo0J family partition protein [Providencia rettgeri]MDU7495984.1 ParB family protein [Providencia rettgeri]UQZ14166.1 ParB/RepB/Spo0J family partition protein [Providencia stuartii]HEC8326428.1 ParB/RepB/Spo0J family partition protein [Providencia rettgeri]
MQTKRKTIGRTLSASTLTHLTTDQKHSQRFVLKSGKSAIFYLTDIPADELADKTFVRFQMNGRDQNALTPESLVDITRTIRLQQFFPAIGHRIDGKIEILDGSRRRAAALLCNVGLSVLVTDIEISSDDARQLAIDIQTAKEHNLREIGLRLLELRENGMSQKEIALFENMSAAKVTRAIQAASVPDDIIALFPVQSELAYGDYKLLLTIEQLIESKELVKRDIIDEVNEKIARLIDNKKIASDELKKVILTTLKNITEQLVSKSKKKETTVKPLWEFEDKNTYARKRVKDRGFSYEFNRIPKQVQDELDQSIQSIINAYYSTMKAM